MLSALFRKKQISTILADVQHEPEEGASLNRVLSVRDLTFFGIAAIIGAGSFSSIGQACYDGGPGVIFLFVLCGIACGFTALCYAEFASRIPVAGSAYTYAYASFGELLAWVIGWALLMEYSIGNIYVAFAWSGYFTNLLEAFHIHLPDYLTTNYMAARDAGAAVAAQAADYDAVAANAWATAPMLGSLRMILDLPAIVINVLITWLVYVGVRESRNVSNLMVMIKLVVIVLVIVVGAFYVDIDNWSPFMPNGFRGVMAGVAAVFFAYIGFDAVSTLAEEAKNPQRDLPRGMIYSLVICTVVYVILSLVLTGMVSYKQLGISDPLAEVFKLRGVKWIEFIVSISAVVAMTSVLLVFQMGQPRIWMSMSRDGLMPKAFQRIHPKYHTPSFSTIVTGLVVGLPLLFTNEEFVLDFTSIGTLFAFVLVCGGVLLLPRKEKTPGRFNLPYINAKFIYPALVVLAAVIVGIAIPGFFTSLLDINGADAAYTVPMLIFCLLCIVLAVFAFVKQWSLLPLLGLSSCLYLLTGMEPSNWRWFFIWFLIGLVIYFSYGYKKSKLAQQAA